MSNDSDRRKAERRIASKSGNGLRVIDRRTWVGTRSDRRTLARLPEQIPVLLSPEDEIFKEFREFAVDISSRGLRVRSTREFPIGSKINLCLYPPDLFVPIQVSAKVEWRKTDAKNKSFVYGFSFNDPTAEYQDLLNQFIVQRKISSSSKVLKKALTTFFYKRLLGNLLKRSLIGTRAASGRSDSGFTFDHIYSNKGKGNGIVGKFVDQMLLNLPAAKASRHRKDLIKEALSHEIKMNMAEGQKTRIVDLGAGAARYLVESVGAKESIDVEALCIDRDKESVIHGRRVAGSRPFRFLCLDIFKSNRLQKLSLKHGWKPNVIIVSGLIYYFSDKKVKALLSQIYEWLEPNGLLIMTNMIQNPNKKLIGNLFITQGGDPWIPLARPANLVRDWIDKAGFQGVHHVKDQWGMYNIFSARKDRDTIKSAGFEFPVEGDVFRGKVYRPTNSKKIDGVVVFVHGLGYTFSSYRLNPNVFCGNNLALALYNMAGHGNSTGEWTLENSVTAVSRSVDRLAEMFGNGTPVYVLAHSTGGLIAILAGLKDRRIRGLSIVNLVNSVTDSYRHWHKSGYNQRVKEYFKTNGTVPPLIDAFLDDQDVMKTFQQHGRPWTELEFPYRYGLMKAQSFSSLARAICFSPDLISMAKEVFSPMLLFSGVSDEIIPVEKTDQFAKQLRVPHAVINTGSSDHFQADQWGLIQSRTVDFILENKSK